MKLKWINDLIVNNKKIGGVLCESEQEDCIIVFIGIGINVQLDQSDLDHYGCLE